MRGARIWMLCLVLGLGPALACMARAQQDPMGQKKGNVVRSGYLHGARLFHMALRRIHFARKGGKLDKSQALALRQQVKALKAKYGASKKGVPQPLTQDQRREMFHDLRALRKQFRAALRTHMLEKHPQLRGMPSLRRRAP